jgi:hypothetical protein
MPANTTDATAAKPTVAAPIVGVVMGSRSDRARSARGVCASHPRCVVRLRHDGAIAWVARHHRRRRRCSAPAGNARCQDLGACARRASAVEIAQRDRLAAVDRADARRRSGGDVCDRPWRRGECSVVCRCNAGHHRSRDCHRPGRVSRAADGGGDTPRRSTRSFDRRGLSGLRS